MRCALLVFFVIAPLLLCSQSSAAAPGRESAPPAGGKYMDPLCHAEVLRVTDRSDADMNYHVYSYWSPFNANSTRFFITTGNIPMLYELDPEQFKIISKKPLLGKISISGLDWDQNDPNIIYGTADKRLYAIDISKSPFLYHLVKDFEGKLPAHVSYLTTSRNSRWFSFIVGGQDNNQGVAAVYDIQKDALHICDLNRKYGSTNLHSATIDKSGKFVWLGFSGGIDKILWNIESGETTTLKIDSEERAEGHRAMGWEEMYHLDCFEGGNIIKRDLKNPKKWTHVLKNPGGIDFTQEEHISANHFDQETIVVSRISGKKPKSPLPLQDEIFQLWTDGSSRTRSLAYHRSVYQRHEPWGTYYSSPKAASSYDGRFVLFTSNWNGSPYVDVFIVKVPPPK